MMKVMKKFDLLEYQRWTETVAVYPPEESLNYLVTGLAAEAGEVADKYAKFLRGDKALDEEGFIKEVGDVVWFCARLCDELGYDLSLVLENNRKKLEDRKARGVIRGNGDNR